MKTRTVMLTALVLAVQCAGWLLWWRQDGSISRENGPMENYQAAAILVGLAFLIHGVFRASGPPQRVCLAGLALFYFDFLLMEVDTRRLGVSWLAYLCNGVPRGVLLGSLWAAAGVWFWRHRRETWRLFLRSLRAAPGVCLMASSFFWILGRLAEELKIAPMTKQFVEEIPETIAALLMSLAGWAWARSLSRASADAETKVVEAVESALARGRDLH